MNRSEFNEILEILYTKAINITKDTFRRDLLLFLTYTGHTVVYRLIRELFGISLTTAFRLINRMTNFIYLHAQDYVFLPNRNELEELATGFEQLGNISGNVLSIDGTFIRIKKPVLNGEKYFNRKKYYAINILMLVDYKKRIRYITSGYGKNHVLRVYRNSNGIQNYIEGLPENFWIVGDCAFRSIQKIRVAEDFEDINFNDMINLKRQRVVVENAFGLLKSKFCRFEHTQKNGDSDKHMKLFVAVTVIHNILINII